MEFLLEYYSLMASINSGIKEKDLGSNNITVLLRKSFYTLENLDELDLSSNNLVNIDEDAFLGLKNLQRLVLHNCGLKTVPFEALSKIPSLTTLQLNNNAISELANVSFESLTNLKNLRLEGNFIENVPTESLVGLSSLELLNLGNNQLKTIERENFPELPNLIYLLLKRNRISDISSGAFSNLTRLKVLDLDDNILLSLPSGLRNLTSLQELSISNNRIKIINRNSIPINIVSLEFKANPLNNIEDGALQYLPKLRKLVLSDSRGLSELPSLDGCKMLETIRIDRANLSKVPENFCKMSPRLRSLEMKSNKLTVIPNLTNCRELKLLDLSDNQIVSLHYKPFDGLNQLQDLLISYNQIETIPFDALTGLTKLQSLDMEGNHIGFIHQDAFAMISQLEDLNLGNNIFPHLPTRGLENLLHLKTFNNPKLREFPLPENFKRIKTLVLSYAYHCCAFLPLMANDNSPAKDSPYKEEVFFPSDMGFDMSLWNNSFNDIWSSGGNVTDKLNNQLSDLMETYGADYSGYPGFTAASYPEEYYEDSFLPKATASNFVAGSVQCLPTPGPFLPCQDLFDWWTLRCGVWVVFLMAMLGNGTVVFVLLFSRSKMDVPRFLVCNLAAADFFMGIYLGVLAVVDASTLGEFRMYAIPWQMSAGCQIGGFLAVLSSELSVYTLAVITLERNYAITHAMHLNKRLSLRHASYIMAIGWTFALTMAFLPLFGVSDYRKFAVCLPFEVENGSGSLAYVVFLMFINGVAFLILMGCYLKMYCAIRGSQAWNSNDSRIAKRMALLVFTDFICWSPIAFFSLTAVFGLQLISLEQAKVFTVFVLPLNSCCNPFLYAILTKQFKKDCVMICKAIEESRVTRGIGRCRHSSNFSNRHTPGNTNSLMDRSSREMPPLLTGHTCTCGNPKVLDQEALRRQLKQSQPNILIKTWRRLLCDDRLPNNKHNGRIDSYSYQIADIQQKNHKRAGSMSSSENFSSSRSDSWRQGNAHHHCGIPLRLLDPKRRHTSWLITRKTSQDSNLSSSRNDSSGSNNTTATTASASTWKMSKSSGSAVILPGLNVQSFNTSIARQSIPGNKPRLVRQSAVHEDSSSDMATSPPRLNVRILPTIPSAPDSSVHLDELDEVENNEDNDAKNSGSQFYTVLESGYPLTKLSSPKDKSKPP